MPLAKKNLNTVARLAMGTAMITILAGCDGRFGRAFDTLVSPVSGSDQTVETVPVTNYAYEYVTPGVPTYTEQTQAANVQTFESVYGPPVVETATGNYVSEQSYAVPSFNDGMVDATPLPAPEVATYTQRVQQETILTQPIYGGASIDTGAISYSEPVQSTYTVATLPAAVVPSSTLPTIDGSYSVGEEILGLDTAGIADLVETGPVTLESGPAIDTFETTTILDSGFDALPVEQTYSDIVAPAVLPASAPAIMPAPAPAYDIPSNGAVQIISNEEAAATFAGEAMPAPLPPVESSIFDVPAEPNVGGQFQVTPQTRLDAPAPEIEEASLVETMWNNLTTSTAGATSTMAPVDADADFNTSATYIVPVPKPVSAAPVAVEVAVVDNSLHTAPTPRQRPARAYATLTDAPLPQPRPAYSKPVAMATTAGNYVSIGALPASGIAPLAAPQIPVDAMLPASATEGDAMVVRDAAPAPVEVAVVTVPEPAAPVTKMPSAMGGTSELSGTSWRLVEVGDNSVDTNAELHFDGRSGFAGGQGPCNSYGGEFRNTGKGNFAMSDIFTTDLACPSIAVEKQYIDALENARGYKISNGFSDLMLLDAKGEPVAAFRAF